MPKEYSRTERVADVIQHALAIIMQREVEDPHLKLVTITAVSISPDLSLAKIFITQLDDQQPIKETVKKLNQLASFLRYKLAHSIKLRIIPQLKFIYDASIKEGAHLSNLINEAIAKDEHKSKPRSKSKSKK